MQLIQVLRDRLREDLWRIKTTHRQAAKSSHVASTSIATLPTFLPKDQKLKDLYAGAWQGYGYKSRSEAELALVSKLVYYGYGDGDIFKVPSD